MTNEVEKQINLICDEQWEKEVSDLMDTWELISKGKVNDSQEVTELDFDAR